MDDKKTLPAITPELKLDLKAKHGENRLHLVTVETGEEDRPSIEYILKVPGKSVFEAIAKYKDSPESANKVLIANCVLAGDNDAFENDGSVYGAVMAEVAGLMKRKKSSIKKL